MRKFSNYDVYTEILIINSSFFFLRFRSFDTGELDIMSSLYTEYPSLDDSSNASINSKAVFSFTSYVCTTLYSLQYTIVRQNFLIHLDVVRFWGGGISLRRVHAFQRFQHTKERTMTEIKEILDRFTNSVAY
jgi:hypothetical protein